KPINDTPIANDLNFMVSEDSSKVIEIQAFDQETKLEKLEFSILTPPSHGTLTKIENSEEINADPEKQKNNSFIYTPPSNLYGETSFIYSVKDDDLTNSKSARGTISISVVSVNDLPNLEEASFITKEDIPFNGILK